MAEFVRIVPVHNLHGGPTLTNGTKFYAGDTEIKGVIKVELIADINDIWRAVLHLHVIAPDEVSAEAEYMVRT